MANQFGCFEFNENIISRNELMFTVEDFIEYYITTNHSAKETCEHFKFSGRILQKIMKHYKLIKSAALSHEINKRTCLKLYGDPTYNNQAKLRQTNLEKYGCENVFQASSIKAVCSATKRERYDNEHYVNPDLAKKTCLERYGYASTSQVPEFKEKKKQTCLKHYGVEYPMQSKEVQAKYNFNEIKEKAFETKKRNGTTNTSKIQQWFISELKKIYGEEDILVEYKEERYPYHCDAYIKSLDIFIELNIYFTHGGHKFDANAEVDKAKLDIWKAKSVSSQFFKNAIEVWTITDPAKIKCAEDNNLKYLTFYTEQEIRDFIKNLKED